MTVINKVIKEHPLYINIKANLEEACDHTRDLEEHETENTKELSHLADLICFKRLDEEYLYFREHAHPDEK